MNDLENVTKWCDDYKERSKIKFSPVNAPLIEIIDDLLGSVEALTGSVEALRKFNDNLLGMYNSMNKRVTEIEDMMRTHRYVAQTNTDSIGKVAAMIKDLIDAFEEIDVPEPPKTKAKAKKPKTQEKK